MKKQIENNQMNSVLSSFYKYPNKKDDEDDQEDSDQTGNLFSGNHYIC